jgi:ABC-type Mn2+/Zn2+ transport system ATPase subunit
MESMDIDHLSNREIGTLSAGQRRRAPFGESAGE